MDEFMVGRGAHHQLSGTIGPGNLLLSNGGGEKENHKDKGTVPHGQKRGKGGREAKHTNVSRLRQGGTVPSPEV